MKSHKKLLSGGVIAIVVFLIGAAVWTLVRKSSNPEELVRSAANLSASNLNVKDAQAQSYAAAQLPSWQSNDRIFGASAASLKIFVYEDYTSIYSAELADTLAKVKTDFGDKIAIIVRPYLKNSPAVISAAAAVDCAGAQGKWAEMRSLLFARVKGGQSAVADLDNAAQQAGLDISHFDSCLTNEQKSGKIEASVQDPTAASVQGAPTIFVGDEMIPGARPYSDYVDSNGDHVQGLNQIISNKLAG